MLQKMRVLLLVCVTAVLAACGGGGDDTPSFVGNYSLKLNLISNNCNAAVPASLVGTVAVNQNDRNVTIVTDGITSVGTVDADNGGFSVSNTQVSSGIPVQTVIAARTVTAGSSYAVRYSVTANQCSAIYTGTATKI